MLYKDNELNRQLIDISKLINNYLTDRDHYAPLLDDVENWLKTQFERLRVQKLKDSKAIIRHGKNGSLRDDAIFIFDSSMKIIHYSGPKNYFTGSSFNQDVSLTLFDFIDEAEHGKLIDMISMAKQDQKNASVEVHVKTGTGMLNKCILSIDMAAGNIQCDRYVACMKLPENVEYQLSEYQSIIFDNLPGMDVYLFDRDYRYIVAAGKEKEKFQLTNSDLIGKTMFEIYDKKSQRSFFPFYNKAINGESTEGEIRYRGDVYYMVATPVKDYENNTVAGILISQNVTNDKLLEEQLKRGKDEAQRADKAKSIFIANISHEIRTPLSAIMGFSEQLEKTELSPKQARYLSLIKKASDHLLYLVTEIVFLFKIGMGKVYLEKRPFSPYELIGELNDQFLSQAAEKKLQFLVEESKDIPKVLIGDQFRLRQILMNLLVNAIKYTDNGTVKLTCRVKKEYKKKVKLVFKVSDTGVGISNDDLPKIFNVFEQGEKLTINIRSGAGLGLGICHRLVELLGGEITVKSKLNMGTTFTVVLPFEKATEDILVQGKKQFNIADEYLAGKKILMADDDEHNLLLAGMILKSWKTDHVLVKNGEDALHELRTKKFDLVLLDIHMPMMDGVEVIRAVRSERAGLNSKILALAVTANALKSDIHKYLKAGFDDYLIKPFREAELYNKLCNVLGFEPLEEVMKEGQDNAGEEATDDFNTSELLNTANGDMEFFNTMINNFINNSNVLKDVFEINLRSGNWEEIGEKAHKAIPSFKYFGLTGIASRLGSIEDLALRQKKYQDLPVVVTETISRINMVMNQAALLKKA